MGSPTHTWKGGASVAQNLWEEGGRGLGGGSHSRLLFVLGFTGRVPWQHQLLDRGVRRTLRGEAVFLKEEKEG